MSFLAIVNPEWFQLGFAAAVTLSLLTGIWKSGRWFGINILVPIKDRVIAHIDKLDGSLDVTLSAIRENHELVEQMASIVEQVSEALHEHAIILRRIDKSVSRWERDEIEQLSGGKSPNNQTAGDRIRSGREDG